MNSALSAKPNYQRKRAGFIVLLIDRDRIAMVYFGRN